MANTITIKNAQVLFDARTPEQWTQVTKNIPKGYLCVELADDDTMKLKVGDGTHKYSELPYVAGGEVDLSKYSTTEQMNQAIADAISSAISDLGNLYRLKGRVDNMEALEQLQSTAKVGDTYLVGEDGESAYPEYYWTGDHWEYMGETNQVDLSDYYKKGEVDALLADKIGKDDILILNCTLPEE